MLPLLVLLALSFILALVLQHLQTRRLHQMTKHIPAPRRLPLLGNGLEFLGGTSTIISSMVTHLNEYEEFVPMWLGPELLIFISHPDDLQVFFSSTKITDRSKSYKFIEPALGHEGLFTANGDAWRRNRRLIAPSFHPNVLKSFTKIFYKHSNVFLDVIRKEVGHEFDVIPYMKRLGYDLILETSVDHEMNVQLEGSTLLTNAMRLMDIINERIYKAWLHPDLLFNMTPVGREHNRLVKAIKDTVAELVTENQERMKRTYEQRDKQSKRSAFIYHMMDAGFEPLEIVDQISTIIVTGFDTTAVTLSFVMMMLGMHQDVQEKLYQEVVAVEESLAGREIEMEDLNEYKYMELVMKETMRLFPVGPIISRTCTEDLKFSKYLIPKGTDVAAVVFKTHRDPRWFPDPLRFNPDRFLPENSEGRHPYCYVPFSAGPRNCIGGKYAMMSMKIVLSRFLLNYKVHCRFTIPEMKIKSEITSKVEGGFLIKIEERNKTCSPLG